MKMNFDQFNLSLNRKVLVYRSRMGWATEMTDMDFDNFLKRYDIKLLLRTDDNDPFDLRLGRMIILNGKFGINVSYDGQLVNNELEKYMAYYGYKYERQHNWGERLYFVRWF